MEVVDGFSEMFLRCYSSGDKHSSHIFHTEIDSLYNFYIATQQCVKKEKRKNNNFAACYLCLNVLPGGFYISMNVL